MRPLRVVVLATIAVGLLGNVAPAGRPHGLPQSSWTYTVTAISVPIGQTSAPSIPVPVESIQPPDPSEPVSPVAIVRAYAWADRDDDPIALAATFTLVKGITPRQALAILVDKPTTPVESPYLASAWVDAQNTDQAQYIEAGTRDGWTVILEPNGFQATDEKTLDRLSQHGTAVVIYDNVNAESSFQYARNGKMLRCFDTLLYSNCGGGPPLPQEHGLGFGKVWLPIAESMALTQRVIGVRIRLADLEPTSYSVAVGTNI